MSHLGHRSFLFKHRSLKRESYFFIFVIRENEFFMSVSRDPLFFRFVNRARDSPCTILYLQQIPACKMSFFPKIEKVF